MIYLDNNATTFIDSEVKKEIFNFYDHLSQANPSSYHRLGQKAKGLLNEASNKISQFFHVHPDELIFTSGATEALNMVIKGMNLDKGHIISSAFEHRAVLQSLQHREKEGFTVSFLNSPTGGISLKNVEDAMRPDTRMIVLMAVNNETGIKSAIDEIAHFAQMRSIPFIVDAVALLGKEPFNIPKGVSAICFSGHKIHGPTGIGLAIVKKGVKFSPLIVGGFQQRGKRSGTENLVGIVGLVKALECLQKNLPQDCKRMERLRNRFEEAIMAKIPGVTIHGKKEDRICNVSNISFPFIDGETMLIQLDLKGIAVSHGAACSTGGLESSHVLINMQIPPQIASSAVRFSLSRFTTEEEIDQTVNVLTSIRSLA